MCMSQNLTCIWRWDYDIDPSGLKLFTCAYVITHRESNLAYAGEMRTYDLHMTIPPSDRRPRGQRITTGHHVKLGDIFL